MSLVRVLTLSLIAFLVFGAIYFAARTSETLQRWWPFVRSLGYMLAGLVALGIGKLCRGWWLRRRERKNARLGLAFDPIRRLRR